MKLQRRSLAEVLRDEMLMHQQILKILAESPKTIPELAESLRKPEWEVSLWMSGMWRYDMVEETGKANRQGYYSYKPKD